MSVRSFFDTNVLLYADDKSSPVKQRRAQEIIGQHRRDRTGVLSIQILQEYFAGVTRKLRVDTATARRQVELLAEFDVVVPDVPDVLAAIDLHRLHQFSLWDGLVLHSAQQAGCRVLLTEDFQTGRTFDGVLIVNPFA